MTEVPDLTNVQEDEIDVAQGQPKANLSEDQLDDVAGGGGFTSAPGLFFHRDEG